MKDIEDIIKEIHEAFGSNEYPGDAFLQGSFEGCEPYEEVSPFEGKTDPLVKDQKLRGLVSHWEEFLVEAINIKDETIRKMSRYA